MSKYMTDVDFGESLLTGPRYHQKISAELGAAEDGGEAHERTESCCKQHARACDSKIADKRGRHEHV